MKTKIQNFFKSEIAIGVLLLVATSLALFAANSSFYELYRDFFALKIPLNLNFIYKDLTLLEWVNDALMAVFFLLVGMELKREILIGELSTRQKISLPAIAAAGGVIIPLLIFVFFNYKNPEHLKGFAIPCATDIAFAYGMLALFGKTISNSAKIFLVALAVIDDLIAIIIIAFFYTENINFYYLALAIALLCALYLINISKVKNIFIYLILGILLWLVVLKSGIHASIAGVALAMLIPLKIGNKAMLAKLSHQISPFVNFIILPIFAFANAGVHVENFSSEIFLNGIFLGVALGLFFGKQIGVMLFSFLAIKLKISALPRGTNWLEFYAVAIFTGIGFTMSLFVGSLAFFANYESLNLVKLGVLFGSLASVIFGSLVIMMMKKKT